MSDPGVYEDSERGQDESAGGHSPGSPSSPSAHPFDSHSPPGPAVSAVDPRLVPAVELARSIDNVIGLLEAAKGNLLQEQCRHFKFMTGAVVAAVQLQEIIEKASDSKYAQVEASINEILGHPTPVVRVSADLDLRRD